MLSFAFKNFNAFLSRIFSVAILLVVFVFNPQFIEAASRKPFATISSSAPSPIMEGFLSWLPDPKASQQKIFDYLKGKVQRKDISTPIYPDNDLMKWSTQRYEAPDIGKEKIYEYIFEDLLICGALNTEISQQQRRRSLRLALSIAAYTNSLLADNWLVARIQESYILPNLSVSTNKRWQDLSIQKITENAAIAFERANEKSNQIALLRLLLIVDTDKNNKDWVRAELAQALAAQEDYLEAISLLESIQSSSFSSVKSLIPQYKDLEVKKQAEGANRQKEIDQGKNHE